MATSLVEQLEELVRKPSPHEAEAFIRAKRQKLRSTGPDNLALALWQRGRMRGPHSPHLLRVMLEEGLDPNGALVVSHQAFMGLGGAARDRVRGPWDLQRMPQQPSWLTRVLATPNTDARHALLTLLLEAGARPDLEERHGPWVQAAYHNDGLALRALWAVTPEAERAQLNHHQLASVALSPMHSAKTIVPVLQWIRTQMGPLDPLYPVSAHHPERGLWTRALATEDAAVMAELWDPRIVPLLSEKQQQSLWEMAWEEAVKKGVEAPLFQALVAEPVMRAALDRDTELLCRYRDQTWAVSLPLREKLWQPRYRALNADSQEGSPHQWAVHEALVQAAPPHAPAEAGGLTCPRVVAHDESETPYPRPPVAQTARLTHGQLWASQGRPLPRVKGSGVDFAVPHPETGESPVVWALSQHESWANDWVKAAGGWGAMLPDGASLFAQAVHHAVRWRDAPAAQYLAKALREKQVPAAALHTPIGGQSVAHWCQNYPILAQAWSATQGRLQRVDDRVERWRLWALGSNAPALDKDWKRDPQPLPPHGTPILHEVLASEAFVGTVSASDPRRTVQRQRWLKTVLALMRAGESWPDEPAAFAAITATTPDRWRYRDPGCRPSAPLSENDPRIQVLAAWAHKGWRPEAWSMQASHEVLFLLMQPSTTAGVATIADEWLHLDQAPQPILQALGEALLNPGSAQRLWRSKEDGGLTAAPMLLERLVGYGLDLCQPLGDRSLEEWLPTWDSSEARTREARALMTPGATAVALAPTGWDAESQEDHWEDWGPLWRHHPLIQAARSAQALADAWTAEAAPTAVPARRFRL